MQVKDEANYHSDLSRVAKNAGVSGVGEVVFNILAYGTSILITRTVGPAIFGVFSLANIITIIAQVFASSGPGHGLLRFVAYYKGRGDIPRLKGAIIFGTKVAFYLSFFLTFTIFFLADFIAIKFFHNPDVSTALKILIISLPFLTIGNIWLECIQSFQVIKYQVYTKKFFQPATRLILTAVLFLFGLKLAGILIATIISTVVGFFFALHYLIKIFPFHKRLVSPIYEKREIVNFSLPISFIQYFGLITLYVDSLMLGHFQTAVEVGIYSAVVKIALLIELPLISFNTILGPMIAEFFGKHKMTTVEDLFKVATKWTFTLSLPVFLAFILFAKPIMGIFGEGFEVGALALVIYGAGELINASTGSSGLIITMTGRPKINLLNSIVFGLCIIILNYFLIPKYGIIGAAVATGFAIAIINILKVLQVYLILRIHPYKLDYLKPVIAGLLSFLVVVLITNNRQSVSLSMTILFLLLFLVCYGFFMYLFKFEEEDRYILQLIWQKLNNVYKNKFT